MEFISKFHYRLYTFIKQKVFFLFSIVKYFSINLLSYGVFHYFCTGLWVYVNESFIETFCHHNSCAYTQCSHRWLIVMLDDQTKAA
jgi:hypothetical protein